MANKTKAELERDLRVQKKAVLLLKTERDTLKEVADESIVTEKRLREEQERTYKELINILLDRLENQNNDREDY
jgi:hypothetical protein